MKKVKLTLSDFLVVTTPKYVPWENIKKVMYASEFKKFKKWMSGQTCLASGVYPHDLAAYLEGRGVDD